MRYIDLCNKLENVLLRELQGDQEAITCCVLHVSICRHVRAGKSRQPRLLPLWHRQRQKPLHAGGPQGSLQRLRCARSSLTFCVLFFVINHARGSVISWGSGPRRRRCLHQPDKAGGLQSAIAVAAGPVWPTLACGWSKCSQNAVNGAT